jgi:hypothetical protein
MSTKAQQMQTDLNEQVRMRAYWFAESQRLADLLSTAKNEHNALRRDFEASRKALFAMATKAGQMEGERDAWKHKWERDAPVIPGLIAARERLQDALNTAAAELQRTTQHLIEARSDTRHVQESYGLACGLACDRANAAQGRLLLLQTAVLNWHSLRTHQGPESATLEELQAVVQESLS